jgi:hypothetical protein
MAQIQRIEKHRKLQTIKNSPNVDNIIVNPEDLPHNQTSFYAFIVCIIADKILLDDAKDVKIPVIEEVVWGSVKNSKHNTNPLNPDIVATAPTSFMDRKFSFDQDLVVELINKYYSHYLKKFEICSRTVEHPFQMAPDKIEKYFRFELNP